MRLLIIALACLFFSTSSFATGISFSYLDNKPAITKKHVKKVQHNKRVSAQHNTRASAQGLGGRPGKWCGWWMRTQFGGGAEYNLARNWAKRGSPTGPSVGAVVVWPHHVGYIVGKASNGQWIVKSGNDGGRVRERARSVAGAIAFRSL
jgi:hypothetical protein